MLVRMQRPNPEPGQGERVNRLTVCRQSAGGCFLGAVLAWMLGDEEGAADAFSLVDFWLRAAR
jgi:hypothetical protein